MTAVGRSPSGLREQLAQRLAPAADRERRVRDEAVLEAAPPAARRGARSVFSRVGERVLVAGDEADALVPELDQVLGRDAAGRALVDADRRHVEVLGATVHEDEPRAALEELRVVGVPARGRP